MSGKSIYSRHNSNNALHPLSPSRERDRESYSPFSEKTVTSFAPVAPAPAPASATAVAATASTPAVAVSAQRPTPLRNIVMVLLVLIIIALIHSVALFQERTADVTNHRHSTHSSRTGNSDPQQQQQSKQQREEDISHRLTYSAEDARRSRDWMLEHHLSLDHNARSVFPYSMKNSIAFHMHNQSDESLAFSTVTGVNVWDLYPPTLTCPDSLRLGKVGEGGKWVCGLSYLQLAFPRLPFVLAATTRAMANQSFQEAAAVERSRRMLGIESRPELVNHDVTMIESAKKAKRKSKTETETSRECIVYCFGVSVDMTFELEILLRTNCRVFAFDPTIGSLPLEHLPSHLAPHREEFAQRIVFHKIALASVSGTNDIHALTESLQDIMHRLGHSAVDLMKMDIEGGEWSVFDNLRIHNHRFAFPVGQLLIELHHQSLRTTDRFFESMYRLWGMQVFSREINLQPTLSGNKPVACEYSLINPVIFYRDSDRVWPLPMTSAPDAASLFALSETPADPSTSAVSGTTSSGVFQLRATSRLSPPLSTSTIRSVVRSAAQELSTIPPAQSADWHKPVHAVIYFLTQQRRKARLILALQSLYESFWKDYPVYPVVIFHDDFSSADEQDVQQRIPHMPLRFEVISFSDYLSPKTVFSSTAYSSLSEVWNVNQSLSHVLNAVLTGHPQQQQQHDEIRNNPTIPERTVCDPEHSSLGYRHMCRFHSHGVHDRLQELSLFDHQLEYIMRLDDDSLLTDPIGYDVFRYMKVNNKRYGFVNSLFDADNCVVDLWESMRWLTQSAAHPMASLQPTDSQFFYQWPAPLVFYNNFEISHASLWRDKRWLSMRNTIDRLQGIYTLRWGDAPIHSIAVSMLCNRSEVHAFDDIAYRHSPFVNQRSSGQSMPALDAFAKQFLHCDYYDKWSCQPQHLPDALFGDKVTAWRVNASINASAQWIAADWQDALEENSRPLTSGLEVASALSSSILDALDDSRNEVVVVDDDGDESLNSGMARDGEVSYSRNGDWNKRTNKNKNKNQKGQASSNTTAAVVLSDRERAEINRWYQLVTFSLSFQQPSPSAAVASSSSAHSTAKVLFTFAHAQREDILFATIRSFYWNFAREFAIPIVIFHLVDDRIDVSRLQSLIGNLNAKQGKSSRLSSTNSEEEHDIDPEWTKKHTLKVTFVAINASIAQRSLSPSGNGNTTSQDYCRVRDPSVSTAMLFLRINAHRWLAERGFEWAFRFGDDSRLASRVTVDLFDQLQSHKQRFAFVERMPGRVECVDSLWTVTDKLCSWLQSRSTTTTTTDSTPLVCASSWTHWRRHLVVSTNFEISHMSLWTSPMVSFFLTLLGEDPLMRGDGLPTNTAAARTINWTTSRIRAEEFLLTISSSTPSSTPLSHDNALTLAFRALLTENELSEMRTWSDSALHTIWMLITLQPHEMIELPASQVIYRYHWFTGATSELIDSRMQVHRYVSTDERQLDRVFASQRIGWLGGDSASSFALTQRLEISADGTALWTPEKVVFLFGDSLLGISNGIQRIAAYSSMVSNTVAIATLSFNVTSSHSMCSSVRDIESTQFYWREGEREREALAQEADGSDPLLQPIFFLTEAQRLHACGHTRRASVWPISGIAITNPINSSENNRNNGMHKREGPGDTSLQSQGLLIIAEVACSKGNGNDVGTTSEVSSHKRGRGKTHQQHEVVDFEEVDTLVIRVFNPLSAPNQWRWEGQLLSMHSLGAWKWISIAESTGKLVATPQSQLMIMASYSPHFVASQSTDAHAIASNTRAKREDDDEFQTLLRVFSAERLFAFDFSALEMLSRSTHHFVPLVSSVPVEQQPSRLFSSFVSEGSLWFDPLHRQWHFVSLFFGERHFQLCSLPLTSDVTVAVDWSQWQCHFVADVSHRSTKDRDLFVYYAGKAHPALMTVSSLTTTEASAVCPNVSMVFSSVSNAAATNVQLLFAEGNKDKYVPHFQRISSISSNSIRTAATAPART